MKNTFGFNEKELTVLYRLNTPAKIQDFLETIPINFETRGETCMSPRRVLRIKKAHCLEGALFAAATLMLHGEQPLLLDLKASQRDDDHVVALFKKDGRWGAISKTNHAILRYREPVYKTVRELALSYFNEYIIEDGTKTLRKFSSTPLDLTQLNSRAWTISEKNLWYIIPALNRLPHEKILTQYTLKHLRVADAIERSMVKITAWQR